MPHIPYTPRPVSSKTPIETSIAPLSSAEVPPDLPSVREEAPDGFLDDFPLPATPKRPQGSKRAPIEPGKPRRRESSKSKQVTGLPLVSMAGFQPRPETIMQALSGQWPLN